jgi:hypothetical protein
MTLQELQSKITSIANSQIKEYNIGVAVLTQVLKEAKLHEKEKRLSDDVLITEIAETMYKKNEKLYQITHKQDLLYKNKYLKQCMILPYVTDIELIQYFQKRWIRDRPPTFEEAKIFITSATFGKRVKYKTFESIYALLSREIIEEGNV